jgi:hypothetical protein
MAAVFGTLRMYLCMRCGEQVYVCRSCDRGQIYCSEECAETQRQGSKRRASACYQKTAQGARYHARRQSRYRARKQKVTDHSSVPMPNAAECGHAQVQRTENGDWLHHGVPKPQAAELRCHFCGCYGDGFVRRMFLHTGRRLL